MLDFILSKINLLILVLAIFSIVAFFAIGLTDIAKVKEASELAFRVSEKSSALLSSSTFCIGDSYDLDPDLKVAGTNYYYVLGISERAITDRDGKRLNDLIFSVYPREEIKRHFTEAGYEPKAIAAKDFRSEAEIHIYSRDYDGTDYTGAFEEAATPPFEAFADPQAINPVDTLHFIRDVAAGKAHLYVIACNSAVCASQLDDVAKLAGMPDGFPCTKRRGANVT